MQRKNIYIYFDEGVSTVGIRHLVYSLSKNIDPEIDIRMIDHKEVIEGRWALDAKLLVIPGGRDRPYHQKLDGTGNHHIKEYVASGGHYLGICAGAYYASHEIVFEKGTPLAIEEERHLKFFPGSAIGTIYPDRTFNYSLESGAKASHIEYKNEFFYAYYNGGCYFDDESKSFDLLGKYKDTSIENAHAIIKTNYGEGTCILSGVHVEYSTALMQQKLIGAQEFQKLLNSESIRNKAFRDILKEFDLPLL